MIPMWSITQAAATCLGTVQCGEGMPQCRSNEFCYMISSPIPNGQNATTGTCVERVNEGLCTQPGGMNNNNAGNGNNTNTSNQNKRTCTLPNGRQGVRQYASSRRPAPANGGGSAPVRINPDGGYTDFTGGNPNSYGPATNNTGTRQPLSGNAFAPTTNGFVAGGPQCKWEPKNTTYSSCLSETAPWNPQRTNLEYGEYWSVAREKCIAKCMSSDRVPASECTAGSMVCDNAKPRPTPSPRCIPGQTC